MRLEAAITGVSLCAWILAGARLAWGGERGALDVGLYGLYAVAAVAGWLAGNVYVHRGRRLGRGLRRSLAAVYGLGPPGLVMLLWAMASLERQAATPLAAVYALGVYAVFFGVPVTLRRAGLSRR